MELVKWSDEYSVGITEIDNQHRGLVIIINELFSLISDGKAKSKLNDIFDHLKNYTEKHFLAEETMMFKFAYTDLENHKNEHKKFIQRLSELKDDFVNEKVTISLEVLIFLKDWLLNHILVSDKKYQPLIEDNY